MSKIVGGFASSLALALVGILARLYFKYKEDWKSIRRVRKSLTEEGDGGCCKYYLVCGLLKIFLGNFYCCCHGCGTRKKSKRANDSNESIFQNRIDLVNNKANAITPTILESMKKNYLNYRYNHRHYCYKNGNNCSPSECWHYSYRKWKGLLKKPVLYLLELNFAELTNNMEERLNKHENAVETMGDLFKKYGNNPLKFIFALVLSKDGKDSDTFKKIENNLHKKLRNICLVAKNFPSEERSDFSEKEKFLLDSLYKLCNPEKSDSIQLIYNVR